MGFCIPEFDLTISRGADPVGRCCYGDPATPSCADEETQADCEARTEYISWAQGLNCEDDPCPAANEGDNCLNPINITIPPASWPYQDLAQYTCGRSSDYTENTCLPLMDFGEDIIYSLDVQENTAVNISFDPKGANAALAIGQNECPPQEPDCLETLACSGTAQTLYNVQLTAGVGYYIIINSDPSLGSSCISDFDLEISEGTEPSGRCCFGDSYFPGCADETQAECEARGDYISWIIDESCAENSCQIPGGNDCAEPIALTTWHLPYNRSSESTCDRDNSYDETCLGSYDSGDDIMYKFTNDGESAISLTISVQDVRTDTWGILIDDTCPPGDVGECIDFYQSDMSSDGYSFEGIQVNPEQAIYLMLDSPGLDCFQFDISIYEEVDAYEYLPGDANMINGQWPPKIIGADVTYLVGYFRGINGPCLVGGFFNAGDANGDCRIIGSDVTRLVSYFRGLSAISHCADYPPAWLVPDDCPTEAPDGWPNCEE
jgi:hypothetical protein